MNPGLLRADRTRPLGASGLEAVASGGAGVAAADHRRAPDWRDRADNHGLVGENRGSSGVGRDGRDLAHRYSASGGMSGKLVMLPPG